jgi:hypothetical protein
MDGNAHPPVRWLASQGPRALTEKPRGQRPRGTCINIALARYVRYWTQSGHSLHMDLISNAGWTVRWLYTGTFGSKTRQDVFSLKIAMPF